MQPSNACYAIIKTWEACWKPLGDGRFASYQDAGGVWTVGWGATYSPLSGVRVGPNWIISQQTADDWLIAHVAEFSQGLVPLITVPCTQPMWDSLVSLTYNIGLDAFLRSILRRKLNALDYDGAACEFDRWVKDNGRVLRGLVARRNDEEGLFRQGLAELWGATNA